MAHFILVHGAWHGGGSVDPLRPLLTERGQRAPAIFAQLSPPDAARAAATRLVAEPSAPRLTAMKLSQERHGSVPRHYIGCLRDRTIPIADQRFMQSLQPCVSVTSLDADHRPVLLSSQELAAALHAISERHNP